MSQDPGEIYNQTRIQATPQDNACTPEHLLDSAPPLFSALDSSNFYTDLSFDQLDLEDTISVANPFSIPIRQRDSSLKYGLSPSSLLYKYSNIAGMPEMDNRTVLSSVHDEANTINSATTATTHTCMKPSSIAMTEHSTIRSPGQGAECNLTSGFPIHDQTTQNTAFAANQGQPYNSMFLKSGFDSSYFPTPADAIFHMHACDDQSITDSVDNLTLFQPNDSGIQDMDTVDTAYPPSALRKVAENFQQDKDDLFLPLQNKFDESSLSARKKQARGFQQPFGSSVDDIGSNYFDSFYDNPQFFPTSSSDSGSVFRPQVLKRDYYLETDSALLDVFFQDDSELMYDDNSHSLGIKSTMDTSGSEDNDGREAFPGNKKEFGSALNQHVARPTKLQTAESTKVVAELLAGLLDDVDVPYYMNEIESGVTSTPDGKEIGFLCEPSSLSMANSWTPSAEKNGLRAGRNPVDMEQGLEQSKRNQAENRGMVYSPSSMDSNSIVSSISSFSAHNVISESVTQTMGLPTPPPLPPPPKIQTQKSATDTATNPQAVAADSEQDNLRQKVAKIIEDGMSADNGLALVSLHHSQVIPLIQDGPCCGLVALTMAKDLMERTDVSFEKILATSRGRGYTSQGEIFSAFDMGALAREVYGCECEVLDMESTGSGELLLRHLVGGNICLVPYDADSNHEPCMKKGHKAHWTLLTGIVFVLRSSETAQLPDDLVLDKTLSQLYHVHDKTSSDTLQHILRMADREHILVYGRQGKSRHTGLWSLGTLLSSNSNLQEFGPQRLRDMGADFILPQDGIVQSLCNKIVILYK